MANISNPEGFFSELSAALDALKVSGNYNEAFSRIDRELSAVFIDHNLPETPGDLLILHLLAGRKASMLREIAGAELVDPDGQHAGWAFQAEQRDNLLDQILGHYQLALAASGRLLSVATSQDMARLRHLLVPELSIFHHDFLGWEEQNGPGGEPLPPLKVDLIQVLFSQHWSIGEYAKAEDLLFLVRDSLANLGAAADQATRDVAAQFYGFLQGLSDDQLESGGLPREELAEAMAEFGLGT